MSLVEFGLSLERRLGVEEGERREVYAAFAANLGIMAAHTLLETARDAAFLARLPASHLPWMYLVVAAASVGLTELDRRSVIKAHSARTVSWFLVVAGLVTASFSLVPQTNPALYVLYVWTALCASWVTVQLSLVLAGSFTVSQAKRLFGFIGAGSILGAVLGSATARVLAEYVSARSMMGVAGALFLCTGVGPVRLVTASVEGEKKSTREVATTDEGLAGNRYGQKLLALLLGATIALTLGDFLFKSEVKKALRPDQLTEFLATVGLGTNVIGLLVQLLVVPWALRTVGAHGVLLVLPAFLSLGAGVLWTKGGLLGAVTIRAADGSLRYSLHRTGLDILYIPLSDSERRRLKPVLEAVGQRGGQCLAALVLLFAASRAPDVIFILLGVSCLLWAAMAVWLRRPYIDLFRELLRRGSDEKETPYHLLRLDLPALESAVAALNSPQDAEVMLALDLLSRHRQGRLIPALILYHPSSRVLSHSLELFGRLGRRDALPLIDRLLQHPDGTVQSAALRAHTTIQPDEALLRRHAEDATNLHLAVTAIVSLLASGAMQPEEARERVKAWPAHDVDTTVEAFARAAIAQPSPVLVPALLAASEAHVSPPVAHALAEAIAVHPDIRFLPRLLVMLESRDSREAARRALVSLGAPALTALADALADPASSPALRTHLPETIRRFAPDLAAPLILARLPHERDGMVRFKLLRSLNRLRREVPGLPLDRQTLDQVLLQTLATIFRLLELRQALVDGAAQVTGRATPAHQLLVDLLHDKERHAFGRALRLINLLLPREDLRPIGQGLLSPQPRLRAGAREVLQAIVPLRYRAAIAALASEQTDDVKLRSAEPFYEPRELTYEQAVSELAAERGVTLRALARYHGTEIGLDEATLSSVIYPASADRRSLAVTALQNEMIRLASRRFGPRSRFVPSSLRNPSGGSGHHDSAPRLPVAPPAPRVDDRPSSIPPARPVSVPPPASPVAHAVSVPPPGGHPPVTSMQPPPADGARPSLVSSGPTLVSLRVLTPAEAAMPHDGRTTAAAAPAPTPAAEPPPHPLSALPEVPVDAPPAEDETPTGPGTLPGESIPSPP